MFPCESEIDEKVAGATKSTPIRIRSPAEVFVANARERLDAVPPEPLPLVCTNEIGGLAACTLRVALKELEPSVAVTVADWAVATKAAVAVNVAVEAAAATEMEADTESAVALLLLRLTSIPPVGAG